jgi:hypothetical protein
MSNNEWKKLHLELPLHTRLVYWAQNEDMIDQYYTMRGADLMDAADRIEKLEKQNGKLKEMFRVHILKLMTNLTHEDIDNHIEEVLKDD